MKKEERIREMIKENSKEVEVPQSLKPENMLCKLEEKDKKMEKRRIYKWAGAMAAVFCLAVAFSMVYGNSNISQYPSLTSLGETKEVQKVVQEEQKDSLSTLESYDVIYQALENKKYELNDSEILYNTVKEEAATSTESDKTSASTEDKVMASHTETNVQVQGIDEADIVKTDGEYLYAAASGSMWTEERKNKINIVKADQGNMKKISTISVNKKFYSINEMYVDKNKLIVIGQQNELDEEGNLKCLSDKYNYYYEDVCYIGSKGYTTYVTIYDIGDKTNPKKVKEYQQSGGYGSSRKIEDILYIFTNFTPSVSENKNKIESYIPKSNKEIIECKDIYFQGETENLDSVVVAAVSLKEPGKVISKKAVYGGGSQFYVSENNIYIYWEDWKKTKTRSGFQRKSQTNITKLKYKDGKIQGTDTCTIDGSIDDSFSMDEQDGYLRVVATCTVWSNSSNRESIKNNLYVLDEKLKISGQIKDLAPGETVQSARFLGDTGYFVTFRQTDPLFSVDLSNPKKPKILGELKVTGFSDYLHFWDENLLLGIGVEADKNGREQGLKVSMFDISDPKNVKEVDRLVLPISDYNCKALENYKEVMVQLDKNRIGFTIEKYKDDTYTHDYYIVTYEKEKGFSYKICSASEDDEEIYSENTRGIGIGDYLYVVIPNKKIVSFQEKENGKWNKVSKINLK